MKIAAVCVTYNRPQLLGRMIRCFELQDYPDRELVVLDDAGQYDNRQGDRWRLVSCRRRFPTLGQKRNAAATLVSGDVEALAVWDDDDLYLSWALSASVAALERACWSRPSVVLHPQRDGSLRQHETGGLFQGGWAYRRDVFHRVGGYPAENNGEDRTLARRMQRAAVSRADPLGLGFDPFYVYVYDCAGRWHLSAMGSDGYRRLGVLQPTKARLRIADPPNLDLCHPRILPGVHPRVF